MEPSLQPLGENTESNHRIIPGRRPAFYIAVFWVLGILAGTQLACDVWILFAIAAFFLSLFFIFARVKNRWVALLFVVFFIAIAAEQLSVSSFLSQVKSNEEVLVEGRVTEISLKEGGGAVYKLSENTVNGAPLRKNIFLSTKFADYDLDDCIRFSSKLTQPSSKKYDEGFDDRLYCMSENVAYRAYAAEPEYLGRKTDLFSAVNSFRYRIAKKMETLFGAEAEVAKAMLIGMDWQIDAETEEDYRISGISHVLCISGMHISILTSVVYFLLKCCKVKRKGRYFISLVSVVLFVALSGFRLSAIRAGIMCMVALTGAVTGRRTDPLTLLSIALIVILLVNPMQLFNAGLQLSFAAVFSIICLAKKLGDFTHIKSKYIRELIGGTLAASIGIFPIIASMNNTCNPLSILINLFVIPFAGVLVPVIAISTIIFGVFGGITQEIGIVGSLMIRALNGIASISDKIDLSVPIPTFPGICILIYYAVIFIVSGFVKAKKFEKGLSVAVAALVIAGAFLIPILTQPEVSVTFLDHYQDEIVIVHAKNGKTAVINTGSTDDALVTYLRKTGETPDLTIITHNDEKTTGGLLALIEQGMLGDLITAKGMEQELEQYRKDVIGVTTNTKIFLSDDIILSVLYASEKPKGENSLTLLLSAQGEDLIVFSAGEEQSIEQQIAYQTANVLDLANKGKNLQLTTELVEKIKPKYVVMRNASPNEEVLALLLKKGITILNTQDSGSIFISFDKTMKVESMYES